MTKGLIANPPHVAGDPAPAGPDPRSPGASRQPVPPACKTWPARTKAFCSPLAYSTQRGYAHSHPFVGEVRLGSVAVDD